MLGFSDDILNINNLNKKISNLSSASSVPSSANTSLWIQWLTFGIAVGVIVVILFFIYRYVKSKTLSTSGLINVIDTAFLDNSTKISIIKIGNDYYSIAYNSNAITKLDKIEDDSLIESLSLNLRTTRTFKDILLSKTTKNFTLQKAKDRLNKLK